MKVITHRRTWVPQIHKECPPRVSRPLKIFNSIPIQLGIDMSLKFICGETKLNLCKHEDEEECKKKNDFFSN